IAPENNQAQGEKFLFYRGLGNFDLPVHVASKTAGAFSLANDYGEAVPTVFAINVSDKAGAFVVFKDGIAAKGALDGSIPSLDGASDLDTFASAFGDEVTKALDATGLYHDEAIAMVNTWKRQWFRTPGPRLFYLAPQTWTEAS